MCTPGFRYAVTISTGDGARACRETRLGGSVEVLRVAGCLGRHAAMADKSLLPHSRLEVTDPVGTWSGPETYVRMPPGGLHCTPAPTSPTPFVAS